MNKCRWRTIAYAIFCGLSSFCWRLLRSQHGSLCTLNVVFGWSTVTSKFWISVIKFLFSKKVSLVRKLTQEKLYACYLSFAQLISFQFGPVLECAQKNSCRRFRARKYNTGNTDYQRKLIHINNFGT